MGSKRLHDLKDLFKDTIDEKIITAPKTTQGAQDVESQDQTFVRNYGLTTKEALIRLHGDMESEIERMDNEFSSTSFLSWLKDSVSFKSELSKMRWPSVLFMTAQVIAHLIVAFVLNIDTAATDWIGFQGFILMALLIINLAVNVWDTRLRSKELLMKARQILNVIKQCSLDDDLLKRWAKSEWRSTRAKTLFAPKSPCIHQTLTYRDESCANLPDYLLVKGDIIHIYPGERAPGDCMSLRPVKTSEDLTSPACDKIYLREGEIFHDDRPMSCSDESKEENASQNASSDIPKHYNSKLMQNNHARLKRTNKGTDFLMVTTPYIKSLRISLQLSHKRPVNSVEKECFVISRKYFETYVIPSVFLLSTVITAIHYGYLDLTDSDQKIKTISIAYLLLRPSLTIMPFLPWMFPCFWLAVNAYGSARLLCCGEVQRKSGKKFSEKHRDPVSEYNHGWDPRNPLPSKFDNLLATPTAVGSSENKLDDDLHELRSKVNHVTILKMFVSLVKGDSGHVWRSSSLLQVLGCLTSLCCIDKVGILSWSNPTPEKVSVLTKDHDAPIAASIYNNIQRDIIADDVMMTDDNSDQEAIIINQNEDSVGGNSISRREAHHIAKREILHDPEHQTAGASLEVLDISHSDHYSNTNLALANPGHLQFDDLAWQKLLNNLKPLGLGILMNNCYEASFGDYFRFYKHISYESILRCNITPVVKRRCMCALSRLIGFSRDAVMNYKYINQIGIYRLINPSSIKKGKLVPSLENTSRLKLPFPNMTCNVYEDITTGGYQMFSQGTADIILDACVEYWDGKRLSPLDDDLRKRIMDFYHRTSLTSYCSAFSYSPLLDSHKLGSHYIELPQQTSKFSLTMRKLMNEQQESFLQNQAMILPKMKDHISSAVRSNLEDEHDEFSDEQSVILSSELPHRSVYNTRTRRHLSVENLSEDNFHGIFKNNDDEGHKGSGRLDETLDEVSDQVFVGMVTLQYQACGDFVSLIEQLEHACIRFVHFSKENELRSRVFSEKLGLESGWNCHISLQSDQDLDRNEKLPSRHLNSDEIPEDLAQLDLSTLSQTNRVFDLIESSIDDDPTKTDEDAQSTDERTLHSWKSLPSLVTKLTARLSPLRKDPQNQEHPNGKGQKHSIGLVPSNNMTESLVDSIVPGSECEEEPVAMNRLEAADDNEALDTLAFDMANRAKLPKGIENIRPHLETVDNIPLQVSLFTDCTPELTKEMIEIMQDYGEIVCVIGSSSSRLNTSIFLQANASIGIEPLMPQSCMDPCKNEIKSKRKQQVRGLRRRRKHRPKTEEDAPNNQQAFVSINMPPGRLVNPRDRLGIGPSDSSRPRPSTGTNIISSKSSSSSSSSSSSTSISSASSCSSASDSEDQVRSQMLESSSGKESRLSDLLKELPEPSSLACKLASLPCSYSYSRRDPVNLYSLILEARHFTFKMKNTFVCLICFALSISSAQFLASLLFLPPMLTSGLTIWLTLVVVPLMSFSLMSTTIDSQVMKIAVGKNLQLKPENITFFVVCYLIKFIPSIIVVVASFGLIIAHSCKLTGFGSSSLGPCWMFTYVQHGNATASQSKDEDLLWSTHLLTAQVCAAFLLVLYFVVISAGFVHRSHLMWQKSPTQNKIWVIISLASILGQLIYNHLLLQVNLSSAEMSYEFLASLPLHIWIITSISPVLVTGINLLVKRAEIKAIVRQQRRARFDFNTKLGMNSPF